MSAVVNNGPLFNAAPEADHEEFGVGDLLGIVIENRWLIIATTAVTLLIGATYNFVATPIYEADGLLQVEERTSGVGDLDVATMDAWNRWKAHSLATMISSSVEVI